MTDKLLEIDNLSVEYSVNDGRVKAVSNFSFTLEKGENFGLVGESGCGKSTLARAIIGGLPPNGRITSGTITYKGEQIQDLTEKEYRNKVRWNEIAWIPQGAMDSLDPLEQIEDQAVAIANATDNFSRQEVRTRLVELFDIMGLPESCLNSYPHQLSGGMKQRVLIAFSLLLEPSIIIADEPTTALDVLMQDQILKYVDKVIDRSDMGFILITHDISVVFESCDQMGVMHAGQLSEVGHVTDVFDTPRHPYSILLQRAFPDIRHPDESLVEISGHPPQLSDTDDYCTFVDRCPLAEEACRDQQPPLESISAGETNQQVACIRADQTEELYEDSDSPDIPSATTSPSSLQQTEKATQEPLLELSNLHKYYSPETNLIEALLSFRKETQYVEAVDDVSLTIPNNESLGIIGESGCGKSTLLRTIIGLHNPTKGSIKYRGEDITEFTKKEMREFRKDVSIIVQDPFDSLDPKYNVKQTIREPLLIHDIDHDEETLLQTLDKVGLNPAEKYINRMPDQLSGGEKQRVSIARAIITEPKLLLADEPVSMLDVSVQAGILNLLSELVNDMGMAMCYISHDVSTVSYVCDTLSVMYLGRIVETGPVNQIVRSPTHPYTQALLEAVPIPDPHNNRERTEVSGTPKEPIGLPEGCRFKDRCPHVMPICDERPGYSEIEANQRVACHLYDESAEEVTTPAAMEGSNT